MSLSLKMFDKIVTSDSHGKLIWCTDANIIYLKPNKFIMLHFSCLYTSHRVSCVVYCDGTINSSANTFALTFFGIHLDGASCLHRWVLSIWNFWFLKLFISKMPEFGNADFRVTAQTPVGQSSTWLCRSVRDGCSLWWTETITVFIFLQWWLIWL